MAEGSEVNEVHMSSKPMQNVRQSPKEAKGNTLDNL